MMGSTMRRRDLFTLTATIAGGTVLGATGCTPHHDAASAEPAPVGFTHSPAWPANRARTEITAVRDRHLVGWAHVSEAERLFRLGWVPIIVNVTGVTTRALLIDDDGTWTTRRVTVKDEPGSGNAPTTLVPGPAAIDDTHAYIVVGVLFDGSTGTHNSAAPVVLLKVRLSDGSVVATTTISDRTRLRALERAALSFTEDGNSLLLACADPVGQDDSWIGLRLSTTDLGVEFDARTLLSGREPHSVSCAGQGVLVTFDFPESTELIALADGHRQTTQHDNGMVLDGWTYRFESRGAHAQTLIANHAGLRRRVEMAGARELPPQPRFFSGNRIIIDFSEGQHLQVWRPGATEPSVDLIAREQSFPAGVAVFNDILYTWRDDGRHTHLKLQQLDSGEVLAERTLPHGLLGSGVGAVTRWGIVSNMANTDSPRFVRATEWLP
ncbi:hypothetical protein [Arachnia propionica]|nr:hypothetical protein [Arachnia propionica]